jgi:hypothetical protein
VPDYFVDQLFFPYGTAEYVRAAVKRGGWAEVDKLWRRLRSRAPRSSTADHSRRPRPDYRPTTRRRSPRPAPLTDTLGEWTLRFLLERGLPEKEAAAAAEGWRGDRIAFFSSAGTTGYLWRIRFDEPASASRFEAALRKARAKRPAAAPETIRASGKDVVLFAGLAKPPELPGWKN